MSRFTRTPTPTVLDTRRIVGHFVGDADKLVVEFSFETPSGIMQSAVATVTNKAVIARFAALQLEALAASGFVEETP